MACLLCACLVEIQTFSDSSLSRSWWIPGDTLGLDNRRVVLENIYSH